MSHSKYIFAGLIALLTVSATVYIREFLFLTALPMYALTLSICSAVLVLADVKAKWTKIIVYSLLTLTLIAGLFYAIYCRRPLGFVTAISSAMAIAYYVIFETRKKRDAFLTKILLCIVAAIVPILLCISALNFRTEDMALSNGVSVLWNSDVETLADKICKDAETDAQKVMAIYDWIIDNIDYDDDYYPVYQYFDVGKTLQTKKGLCFDFANLFAALCRSQQIPCLVFDGYRYEDFSSKHVWNRVYFTGSWFNLDVTVDTAKKKAATQLYGFHYLGENYSAPDPEYRITRIY